MRLTVLGCGDAFGAGGRLQTSFHLTHESGDWLIDCGATALIGMTRAGLDPDHVSVIAISHLHGDHFAGLAWWLIHAAFVSRRTAPLAIAGPPGTEARFLRVAESLYPGSTTAARRFDLTFVPLDPGQPANLGSGRIEAFSVLHPSGAPSYALRLALGGKVIGFSGDAAWGEGLIAAARNADLYITECTSYAKPVPYHLSWSEMSVELPRLEARRILISHMGADMLARVGEIVASSNGRLIAAEDGLVVEI